MISHQATTTPAALAAGSTSNHVQVGGTDVQGPDHIDAGVPESSGAGKNGPGKNGPGKKGPVKRVQVKTVLGKNGPGKKGPSDYLDSRQN